MTSRLCDIISFELMRRATGPRRMPSYVSCFQLGTYYNWKVMVHYVNNIPTAIAQVNSKYVVLATYSVGVCWSVEYGQIEDLCIYETSL